MTGKDLLCYIIDNNLLDEPVFKDGKFMGFFTEAEVAERLNCGTATVRAWVHMGRLDGIRIGDAVYIPVTSLTKLEKELVCVS